MCIFLFCSNVNAKTIGYNYNINNSIETATNKADSGHSAPDLNFSDEYMECKDILGPNLTALVHVGIKALQIIGAIVAIVYGMISLIPAVMSKDSDGLKKAEKKLVLMAIVLLCIFMLPYFVRLIGNIFDFDVTCIF